MIEQLQTEGQARTTLQDSHVFFVHQVDMRNGRIYNDSRILREQLPPDMEGIESRTVHIPGPYEDPITGAIFTPDEIGVLELHASSRVLQGSNLKHLKGIRIHDGRNTVWVEEIPHGNESNAAQRIYGTFTTPSSHYSFSH